MKEYDNKNFRISSLELMGIIIFLVLIVASFYFLGSYEKTVNLYNIEKTDVDFIIQAPSREQVLEIDQLDHVVHVTPYYYRSVDILSGKRTIATNLFIIDRKENIKYTTFSDKLKIKTDSHYTGNVVYVTDDFAKKANINIGDAINISIDGNTIPFSVAGIYKSDYRQVGGSLLVVLTEELNSIMSSMKYSGAYIESNDVSASRAYFTNNYTPLGDLRAREEFDSDESYKRYLDAHSQKDTTMATFVTSDYLDEVARRNDTKLLRYRVLAIIFMVIAYTGILCLISMRSYSYTKNNVIRDVRDNYTIAQETRMYSNYFMTVGILMLASNVISCFIGAIFGWIKIISLPNIAAVVLTVVSILICGNIQKKLLENRFLAEQEKYEKEIEKMAKANVERI